MSKIKLTPLGGLYEFGNQSYLYRLDNTSVLVDAGAFFNDSDPELVNTRFLPDYNFLDNIGKLDAIVITHHHEDHFGGLTYLLKKFPKTPVYCSPFVAANILMRARVEGFDLYDLNGRIHRMGDYEEVSIQRNFKIELLPVDHSVPGACMVFIRTPQGDILHTGDWRYERSDADFLNRLYKIRREGLLALVADSTGIDNKNEDLYSEKQVYKGLDKILSRKIKAYKNIVVSTFSNHVERVRSCCNLSREYFGKDPQFLGTGFLVNQSVAVDKKLLPIRSIKMAKGIDIPNNLYIATGSQAEQGSFLMELSQQNSAPKHPTCIIMSASEIPGRKEKIHQMIDNLMDQGYTVIKNDEDHLTHISGHASQYTMGRLIDILRPEIYVPIHGEGHHLRDAEELARQLNVKDPVRFNRVGETLSMGKNALSSVYSEFKYNKIEVQKNIDLKFIRRLKQNTR